MKVLFETRESLKEFTGDLRGDGYFVALAFDDKHNILSFEEFKKEAEWLPVPLEVELRKV